MQVFPPMFPALRSTTRARFGAVDRSPLPAVASARRAGSVPVTLAALLSLATLATACSQGAAAEGTVTVTVAVSPLPSATVAPTTTVTPTTVPPTTVAPTTVAPTTVPPTTIAPTTVPPTTVLPANIETVPPAAAPLEAVGGRSGDATVAVQVRLLELGFWLADTSGEYGLTTKQAVMAFQKYLGLPANGKVDEVTAAYMTNLTDKPHGASDTGDLIEVDKARQVLFVVRGGKTIWVINASTGNGLPYEEEDQNSPGVMQTGVALTPDGLWKVERERPEGWWEGDLGKIYRPKYFRGGIAVHGSNSVPNHPASHGCVRVSVPAMDFIWDQNLMPLKTPVWVRSA